jgi:hypothetical protein
MNLTSARQFLIEEIPTKQAQDLNQQWHSRLPIYPLRIARVCYGAFFDQNCYAVAIWSNPVHYTHPQQSWLELRRLAISSNAPKNTASRMLRIMTILIKKKFPLVEKLISYQDTTVHEGTIYRAAGWYIGRRGKNGNWAYRGRKNPNQNLKSKTLKYRWEKDLA